MFQVKVLQPSTPNLLSSSVPEPDSERDPAAAWSSTSAYAAGDTVYVLADHRTYECTAAHQSVVANTSGTATMTIASPCVVTWADATIKDGSAVVFSTNGALPAGITAGTTYYVKNRSGTTFNLTATYGGTTLINTTGTQSGTHTCKASSTVPSQRLTGTDPLWLDLGPTNCEAMFDGRVSTSTTLTTSVAAPELVVVVAPGLCSDIGIFDVTGVRSVTCEMYNGATLVYAKTIDVNFRNVNSYRGYFFAPFAVLTDLLFGPLPLYRSATVKLVFTPTAIGATIAVGAVLYGNTVDLGLRQPSAKAGTTDYSKIETDGFGTTTLVKRGFSRYAKYQLLVDNNALPIVTSTLIALRATPAAWIATNDYRLSMFNTFGYLDDWWIEDPYPFHTVLSLELKGLS